MPSSSKRSARPLSNAEIAELSGYSAGEVHGAFKKYNLLLEELAGRPEQALVDLLATTRAAGIREIDSRIGGALIERGSLESSLGELADVPGVGLATIRKLILPLVEMNVPTFDDSSIRSEREPGRPRAPRSRIDPLAQLDTIAAVGKRLLGRPQAFLLPDDFIDFFEDLGEDLESIGDTVDEGKDLFDSAKEAIKKLQEAADILKPKKPRPPPLETAGGSTVTVPIQPKEIDGEITEDEYARIFGEALESEPLYTVWWDRWMAFEVDGAGDDNVYMTVQAKVFLRDPPTRISSSFITAVYDIDEREEYRLKPRFPVADRRGLPLDPDDWKIRGYLETRDASLALRVNGDLRGIPLSKLDKVEISFYLYESDSLEELLAAIAALGAAAIAALGIIKGKFTAPAGSTAEATDAIQRALTRLNKIINSDDKLIEDQFTFTPGQFETAFRDGQTFLVRQRGTTAACGLPFQRIVGALTEDKEVLDTEAADQNLLDNQSSLRDRNFYEDEFESFYDVRVRFERLDVS